jgi:NADH dehydrogenase FAD-containing subunit
MKVLVIGGGFGGLAAIKGLRDADQTVEIVVVEPKEYFECAWAAYRSVFDAATADGSLFDLKAYCESQNVTHIQSVVSKLTSEQATLANGDTVSFDVAVVSTGSGYKWDACGRGPPTAGNESMEARKAILKAEGVKLTNATSVLIVGGGLIGTELAGDVAYYKKQNGKPVNVTLVQSGEQLCPEMSVKAAAMVQRKLEKLGVKIILGDKATEKDGKMVLQKSGEVVDADEVVTTTGAQPLNQFMDSALLNDKGWVEVDDYFRVKGTHGKVFSIGDCCTLLPNSGSQVMGNVPVLGKNIKTVLDAIQAGTPLADLKLKAHVHSPEVYVNTVGPKDGVAYTSMCFTQFLLPTLKNKTFFFFKAKSDLGLK